ncbi:cytochrome P450 [Nocardia arthritidis]|uniref:Cytochrome P450 n=1 Tax=Nocardia arthritidis TaxID=228602 RepID=A0A6G9Y8T5_9NOCA|nr:cytochrome P450 [Nocardia arthritidis]QIS09487.1 cytochrome P450 [Nocardia arthritidis]
MIEVFDTGFAADPWATLDRLRADGGVHRVRTPDGPPAWLVTRYSQVRAGLLDERLTTHVRHANSDDYRGFALPPQLETSLANAAPADHARLRRIVTGELSPRRLAEWTTLAPRLVEPILRELNTDDEVDLVERLAVPLPAAVLGELLGLTEPAREALAVWANSTLMPSAEPPRARDTLDVMLSVIATTKERPRDDTVLGRLVAAHRAGHLDDDELTGLLFYLLFVWYEVLVDLVAGGILTLLDRADQRSLLGDPMNSHRAVDELLRYLSPQVLTGPRFALTDLTIGTHTIKAGQTVLLCLASANHDPEIFDAPSELDLARTRNPHLGLGYGTHACLGTALVHTVTATTIDQVFTRWPGIALTVAESTLGWRSGFRHRGPLTLPVRLA